MTKTTLGWMFIYFTGIIATFVKGPIYGLLNYMFTFYTQFSWAKPYHRERWSLYASIALLISYFVRKDKIKKIRDFKISQLKWLVFFYLNMWLVTPFAVDPAANSKRLEEFLKITILYVLIVCIVRKKLHYKLFVWTQLWGNYLFGWQGYHAKLTRGRLEGIGGPGTNTSNGLANHMVTILPFINNLVFYGNKWEKLVAIYAAPFILNAIILTGSRAAFLGIVGMAIISVVRAKKEIRKKMVVGLILGGILFLKLSNVTFWNRMETIDNPEDEGSASGRLATWSGALEMVKDYPFGKGGDSWLYFSPVYIPEIVAAHRGQPRSVHNSYLEVATNYGIQGFLIYTFFIGSTIIELRNIRKKTGSDDDTFYWAESVAIEIAIWGWLITATFGARPYAEALYWYAALGSALGNIQRSEFE